MLFLKCVSSALFITMPLAYLADRCDGVIETWAPKTVTDAPHVVPLRTGLSINQQRRINSLTAGLLEGRHPLEVLADLADGSQPA